ncbi:MAG: hypothetical protein JWQ71_2894 [Pedosphaera sp.]|nr:hypothetical protein [Pedosphaera sp.]
MSNQQPNLQNWNVDEAEAQIEEHRKVVDYNIIEYPIEVIVEKYLGENQEDEGNALTPEFYIPDYQREHTWDEKRKSKFIESVLIGLPIPFLFLAEEREEEGKDGEGRLEIVDGSQRIRTLAEFVSDNLVLKDLEKLQALNGSTFSHLPLARQRKFNRTTIRIIALSDEADEETRRDLFERINTGSDPLRDMEQRRGIMDGPFVTFIEKCAAHPLLQKLAPLSPAYVKRREREEFALRFFAYAERYTEFDKSVKDFLDQYVKDKNTAFNENAMWADYDGMLNFVQTNFRYGFKRPNYKTAKRVRFEAIAVGSALALRENPSLNPPSTDVWADGEEFHELTTSDSSNSKPKVRKRIEYVRNHLLGKIE